MTSNMFFLDFFSTNYFCMIMCRMVTVLSHRNNVSFCHVRIHHPASKRFRNDLNLCPDKNTNHIFCFVAAKSLLYIYRRHILDR